MNKFERALKSDLLKRNLIRRGSCVLLGVSGGSDSVALLSALAELRTVLGFQLIVGHVNHHWHGQAGQHQKFVQDLCKDLNVDCHVVHLRTAPAKGSKEEWAREQRLNKLVALAKMKKCHCLALAHHRDDLAETVLMRIIRGAGLLGLQGMVHQRELHDFLVIRPFLDLSRKSILVYLTDKKIVYKVDPTNRDRTFLRNRIRNELIPLLEQDYNVGIGQALVNLSRNAVIDYDYLSSAVEEQKTMINSKGKQSFQVKLSDLKELHPALQHLVIRSMVELAKGDLRKISLSHMDEVEDLIFSRPLGSVVDLPGKVVIKKEKNFLRVKGFSASRRSDPTAQRRKT